MKRELLPLDIWAQRKYPERTPSIHTLRRWVREARIVPIPEKHGRAYWVEPNAEYQQYERAS
jgi:predicted site-specific integrase-resolvase